MQPPLKAKIRHLESVESTNTYLKRLAAEGAGPGTVVCAKEQTAGRGQGANLWSSPPGGLYLSALLNVRDAPSAPQLALLAGVAMAQSVREFLPKSAQISLKWPNDCLLNWKKVGGILCELVEVDEGGPLCVVGLGVNVNINEETLAPFQGQPFGAVSFRTFEGSGHYDLEGLTELLLTKLFGLHAYYIEEGFDPIRTLWEQNCDMVGSPVELSQGVSPEKGENEGPQRGLCLGVDAHGALVISHAKDDVRHYLSGKITCFWPST